MQIQRIHLSVIAFIIFMLSGSTAISAHQLRSDTLTNDSTNMGYLSVSNDSSSNIWNTNYLHISLKSAPFIIENPNRQNYLRYKLQSSLSETANLYLISNEYLRERLFDSATDSKKTSRPRWVLLSVFVLFFFVALIKVAFPVEFRIIVEAYYRERLLLQVSKEDNLTTSWPYICLYAVFSFALGLFLIVSFSEFANEALLTPLNFIRASIAISLLFILKIVISRFISFVFELEKIMREYIAVIYLMYFNSMLVLLPFLLFIVLVPSSHFKISLIIFVTLISILFIYRILRTFIHLFGDTQFSISYLILYLCTLEIAPILLLVRALGN